MEPVLGDKKPGLFAAIGIGIGCMIGSGWLFSAYLAAKYVGPASYISWFIGAGLALVLALLLSEIASMYKTKALFARLLVISHNNPDYGFVVSISSWLGMVIVIPAEAAATVQYLSTAFPRLTPYMFVNHQHTLLGKGLIACLVMIFTLINYWGIRSLARASNAIAVVKVVVPTVTAILLLAYSYHGGNFTSHGVAPFGYGHVVSAVVTCGIFYAFFGFSMVAMYSSEMKNPQKNVPRALIISVLLCLGLYLLLQTAFIASLPMNLLNKGWGVIDFTSPFAQLLLLLNIHVLSLWSIVLYLDSAVSPSGTGIIYMGSSSRTITGMSRDKQLPAFFNKSHPVYHLSRRSLIFTALICCLSIFVFGNWQEIMIIVTVFQLISCVAIPIAFVKLRQEKPDEERLYRARFGLSLSYFIYMVLSYLLTQATIKGILLGLIMHLLFFICYGYTAYQHDIRKIARSFASSWSIFVYMMIALLFAVLTQYHMLITPLGIIGFICLFSLNYLALLHQKNYMEGD